MKENREYGYARISTKKQSIERQVRNIQSEYPDAVIVKEAYSGRKINRPGLDKILKQVNEGDTIVFDSVSRMSRNAEDGFELYEELYNKGVELVFLKEQHINTSVFRKATENQIQMTGTNADIILKSVNEYLMTVAKEQIRIAFAQAQKEVDDLSQRTKEGIETARLNGKQIGQEQGKVLKVKKKVPAMEQIKKYSKDFEGTLSDVEVMKLTGLARNTYYKYKKEMKAE